jgi:hypothetical protein
MNPDRLDMMTSVSVIGEPEATLKTGRMMLPESTIVGMLEVVVNSNVDNKLPPLTSIPAGRSVDTAPVRSTDTPLIDAEVVVGIISSPTTCPDTLPCGVAENALTLAAVAFGLNE